MLIKGDKASLRALGLDEQSDHELSKRLNALDTALTTIPTSFTDATAVRQCLSDGQAYFILVQGLIQGSITVDLSHPAAQQLFGLQPLGIDEDQSDLLIPTTSPLHRFLPPLVGQTNAVRSLPLSTLSPLAARYLLSRLDGFLVKMADALSQSKGPLQPPCYVSAFSACKSEDCRRQHFDQRELSPSLLQPRLTLLGE